MTHHQPAPTTVEEVRAAVAAGVRQAASVYAANADLRGAAAMSRRLAARADALDAGASMRPAR